MVEYQLYQKVEGPNLTIGITSDVESPSLKNCMSNINTINSDNHPVDILFDSIGRTICQKATHENGEFTISLKKKYFNKNTFDNYLSQFK